MSINSDRTRILFFIGNLAAGGKERRLIELLTYLKRKGDYDLMVVMTNGEVHFPDFYKLNVPYKVIRKMWEKNDLTVFYKFYKICKQFQPHMIHTWGSVQSFYTLPTVILQRIPLVNSQITSAPPKSKSRLFSKIVDHTNFYFSKIILSNSKAGIESYQPPAAKTKVIYNGINMNRFMDLPDIEVIKAKYRICTPYSVVMAASFTPNKDYDFFLMVARKAIMARDDITFIGAGGYNIDDSEYVRITNLCKNDKRILFTGRINDVEALINACTIGILFSNKLVHGEGISNSVMEYMALSKPVIASDAGGTREIVHHDENGYLITNQTADEVASMIIGLIDDAKKRELFGKQSRKIIDEFFSLDQMGYAFEQVYKEIRFEGSNPRLSKMPKKLLDTV